MPLQVFSADHETWEATATNGEHPPTGLRYGACTSSSGHHVYIYGGDDGSEEYSSSLHQLDTKTQQWTQLSSGGGRDAPMAKRGCAMVYLKNAVIVYGGCGKQPTGHTQPGAEYADYGDGDVITNELNLYDLRGGEEA